MTKRRDYRDAQSLIKDLAIQINGLDKQSDKSKESKKLIRDLKKKEKNSMMLFITSKIV